MLRFDPQFLAKVKTLKFTLTKIYTYTVLCINYINCNCFYTLWLILELFKLVLLVLVIVGIILSLPLISVTVSEGEDPEENCYNLRTRPGLCLYIGLLEFDPEDDKVELEKRHASSAEFKKMQSSFERLGCFVNSVTNPTKEQALEFLQKGQC